MLLVRTLLFYIGYATLTTFYGLICAPFFLLPDKVGGNFILSWNRLVLLWLRICCGVRIQVEGDYKNVPKVCVVVSNHQSPWETFYLQLLLYPVSTVLKKELLRIPMFGWGLRLLQPIAIDRSHPVQALKQIRNSSLEKLKSGRRILLFPEGTRMPYGTLGEYKRSAADIALSAGVPLLPIAHDGGKCWPGKKFIKYPGVIHVVIGEPVTVGEKDSKQTMHAIQEWTQEKINKMS